MTQSIYLLLVEIPMIPLCNCYFVQLILNNKSLILQNCDQKSCSTPSQVSYNIYMTNDNNTLVSMNTRTLQIIECVQEYKTTQ